MRTIRYAVLFAWHKVRGHACYWDRGSFACDDCFILSLEQFADKYIRPFVEAETARFEKEYAAWAKEGIQ